MNINDLHDALKAFNVEVPVIALPTKTWKEQLTSFALAYFAKLEYTELETPLEGLVADLRVIENPKTNKTAEIVYKNFETIIVENYYVEFDLKAIGVASGYLSRHIIDFSSLVFGVSSQDGFIKLARKSENYTIRGAINSDVTNRAMHLEKLKMQYAYSPEQIAYFETKQEPAAGFLVADGLLERLNTPFEILDLNKLFARIGFGGDFKIEDLTVTGEQVICFIPEKFVKVLPTQCQIEEQYGNTYGGGELDGTNGDLVLTANAFPPSIKGNKPRINSGQDSQMYIHLPEQATSQLFTFNNPLAKKVTLAHTKGSFDFPPFYLEHDTEVFSTKEVKFEWNNAEPIIELEASVTLTFFLQLWLKIFRKKTNLGKVDSVHEYQIKYRGKLTELINGDLAFVGELYDPTNFSIRKFELDSILPGFINKVLSKVVKYVFEPLLRVFITAIILYVTWPFMQNYAFQAFINAMIKGGEGLRPRTSLSNYHSDGPSATLGVTMGAMDYGG